MSLIHVFHQALQFLKIGLTKVAIKKIYCNLTVAILVGKPLISSGRTGITCCMMRLFMSSKAAQTSKREWANFTFIWFIPSMNFLVNLQVTFFKKN